MTVVVKPLAEYVPKAMMTAMGEQKVIDYLLENIAEAARDKWIRLAGEAFSSTRRDYVNGIQPVRMRGPGVAVVALVGSFPNALEQGMPSRDMRETLLGPTVATVPRGERGKHAIEGIEDGYYRSIPFRHKGPGGGKSGFGQAMGAALVPMAGQQKARRIGKAIYKMAQELAPTKSVYGDHPDPAKATAEMVYGEATEPQKPWRLVLPEGPLASLYGGMIREEKDYEKAVGKTAQSQFVTFRTISTEGNPWVHPGFEAKDLAAKVAVHGSKIAEQTFAAYAKGAKGE